METISYCESEQWSSVARLLERSIPPSVAEQRHTEGVPYSVVISEASVPRFIVEVTHNYVGVYFLDKHRRPYLQYSFQEVKPGRPGQLFLTNAIYREYEGSTDKLVEGQMFLFTPEGKQVNILQDRIRHTSTQQEATDVNLESNWEVYPAFGQYATFCRAERS
jgi:hypothetical protein